MGWAGRAALVAAVGLAFTASAQTLRRTTLTLSDHLGPGQQEETITIYLAGVLAGTLHVDPDHPDTSFTATVPDTEKLSFTLCGKLLRREPDGSLSTHPIDNGGTLTGYTGASLAAVTLGDVLFTLQDEAGQADTDVLRGPACTAAVS